MARNPLSAILAALTIAIAVRSLVLLGSEQDDASVAEAVGVQTEFVYEEAPFPQCHASTIVETPGGLVAAWFGGTHERHPDVGIWVARKSATTWSPAVEVANGVQTSDKRYPCWNPVLHQVAGGALRLFYKVGPDPKTWWGMTIESQDGGQTWSQPARLPTGILGPIKNKPVMLADGTLLSGSSTEDQGWRVHLESTKDGGASWSKTNALGDASKVQAIQPTILQHASGRLQILCRARDAGYIVSSWSEDGGATWSDLQPTTLPNPNSGIDAVTLRDGRHLLVYNHTTRGRSPLNVAISEDGIDWKSVVALEEEPGEYSYPAVIQSNDGLVHITYTWKRKRVKHVTLDLE